MTRITWGSFRLQGSWGEVFWVWHFCNSSWNIGSVSRFCFWSKGSKYIESNSTCRLRKTPILLYWPLRISWHLKSVKYNCLWHSWCYVSSHDLRGRLILERSLLKSLFYRKTVYSQHSVKAHVTPDVLHYHCELLHFSMLWSSWSFRNFN